MFYKVKDFYRKVKNWLVQSIAYSRFIWENNNYDWDYSYIFLLLRFKLTRISKEIKKNNIIEGTNRVCKQVDYAVWLIDQYMSDDYADSLRKAHEAKWGECKVLTPVRLVEFEKAINEEEQEQAKREYFEIYDKEHKREQEMLDRLFRHMRLYIERWWD